MSDTDLLQQINMLRSEREQISAYIGRAKARAREISAILVDLESRLPKTQRGLVMVGIPATVSLKG